MREASAWRVRGQLAVEIATFRDVVVFAREQVAQILASGLHPVDPSLHLADLFPHGSAPRREISIATGDDRRFVERHHPGDMADVDEAEPAQVAFPVTPDTTVPGRLTEHPLAFPPAHGGRGEVVEGGGSTDADR